MNPPAHSNFQNRLARRAKWSPSTARERPRIDPAKEDTKIRTDEVGQGLLHGARTYRAKSSAGPRRRVGPALHDFRRSTPAPIGADGTHGCPCEPGRRRTPREPRVLQPENRMSPNRTRAWRARRTVPVGRELERHDQHKEQATCVPTAANAWLRPRRCRMRPLKAHTMAATAAEAAAEDRSGDDQIAPVLRARNDARGGSGWNEESRDGAVLRLHLVGGRPGNQGRCVAAANAREPTVHTESQTTWTRGRVRPASSQRSARATRFSRLVGHIVIPT